LIVSALLGAVAAVVDVAPAAASVFADIQEEVAAAAIIGTLANAG
jgi:hypothetical protein